MARPSHTRCDRRLRELLVSCADRDLLPYPTANIPRYTYRTRWSRTRSSSDRNHHIFRWYSKRNFQYFLLLKDGGPFRGEMGLFDGGGRCCAVLLSVPHYQSPGTEGC